MSLDETCRIIQAEPSSELLGAEGTNTFHRLNDAGGRFSLGKEENCRLMLD